MTDFPSPSKISVLTDENLHMVAKAHLGQIVDGTTKDLQVAVTFINTALKHKIAQHFLAKKISEERREQLERTLRFTPHVKTSKLFDVPEEEVEEWLRRNGVEHYDSFPDGMTNYIYVFKTWDDAILFKMRWA